MFNPPHPGEVLAETMEELNLGVRELARRLSASSSTVQRVVTAKSNISPEMAIRLSSVVGSSPRLWLNLQGSYDLWHARQKMDISKLQRVHHA